jgi:hypothetical protein
MSEVNDHVVKEERKLLVVLAAALGSRTARNALCASSMRGLVFIRRVRNAAPAMVPQPASLGADPFARAWGNPDAKRRITCT